MLSEQDKKKILDFYSDGTKHSNYQNFPSFVSNDIKEIAPINESWRGDSARYKYLLDNLSFKKGDVIGDIGANTGRFCLDFAYANKDNRFIAIEINSNNLEFIKLISEIYNMANVEVLNTAVGLKNISNLPSLDVALHMNVLHHAGVDFDKDLISDRQELKVYFIEYLRAFSKKCKTMVFQIGYNWGGNKAEPIIPVDNIAEMINYQKEIFDKSGWYIDKLALFDNNTCEYRTITDMSNIDNVIIEINMRLNSEFYKRPLFIIMSEDLN